ncbi:MAG: isocitrate lyase/PEP mutase family protein [Acidobacteria bacterium]|nr:MAG: isocitrate lyase/PEP mutase family protein [Acidobacteriota bacterium]
MVNNGPRQLGVLLKGSSPVVAPGTFNALFARLIEQEGFPAIYISGAGVANSLLGKPDLGLVSMDEMTMVARLICDVVTIPVIADADTGYGGVHNVARVVSAYEKAGVAAIQLEDQVFPKRCGHFDGKEVVPVGEMLERLVSALETRENQNGDGIRIIARTDAAGPLGLDEAIRRARRYGEAGADLLFVEAPESRAQLEIVGEELSDWPLVANMVEGGKTPLLSVDELAELGFSLILFPGSITRTVTGAARSLLQKLAEAGSTREMIDDMATFDEVNDLVGLKDADEWERSISEESTRDGAGS